MGALSAFDIQRIYSITNDNCPVMRTLNESINKKYHIKMTRFGCICHIYNLMAEHIINDIIFVNRHYLQIVDITQDIENKKVNQIELANMCESNNINLVRFPSTSSIRWITKSRLYNRLIEHKELLQLFVLNTNLDVKLIYLLLDESWWDITLVLQKILNSLYRNILVCERDTLSIFTCFKSINKLYDEFSSFCGEDERFNGIKDIYNNMLKLTNMTLINIANYFDPSKQGSDLKDEQLLDIKQYMLEIATDNEKLATECFFYEQKFDEVNGVRINWSKTSNEREINIFWNYNKYVFPILYDIFSKLSSVSISSCSVERSFSIQGFIKNKARNRLSIESVRKLMLIKFNSFIYDDLVMNEETNDDIEINECAFDILEEMIPNIKLCCLIFDEKHVLSTHLL